VRPCLDIAMLSPSGCGAPAWRPGTLPASISGPDFRSQSLSWIVTPLIRVVAIHNKFEKATWCRETTIGPGGASGYSVRSDKPRGIGPGGRIAYGTHRRNIVI
jgi:hypothetical protein